MNKFDKEYYRKHRFYSNKGYNIHHMLNQEYDSEMVNHNKNKFYVEYPECIEQDLNIFEEELARVEAYKSALEEGIILFKQHYM